MQKIEWYDMKWKRVSKNEADEARISGYDTRLELTGYDTRKWRSPQKRHQYWFWSKLFYS